MSSRNRYLTEQQRLQAPKLYQSLLNGCESIKSGQNFREIETRQQQFLTDMGFKVDYYSICRKNDLLKAEPGDQDLIILCAAKLGSARLIDNIFVS